MPSPFPGMNPYLEQSYDWEDFHNSYLFCLREYLAKRVGPNYFVKTEVRLYLHEMSADERRFIGKGDVGVSSESSRTSIGPAGVATMGISSPLELELPAIEVEKQAYLEIRDMLDRRVVTVVELLSPSNKDPGADRDFYLGKRKQFFTGRTNFVEFNFLRGGRNPAPPVIPACDYYALVIKADDRPKVHTWPFGVRDPMPKVPVPLNSLDPPILVDLKEILDTTYDSAGYSKHIYREIPVPPLKPEDDAWARGIAGLPV